MLVCETSDRSGMKLTIAEYFAQPEEVGVESWLVNGTLREQRGFDIGFRNRFHAIALANIGFQFSKWHTRQPAPRGRLASYGVGFILSEEPPTTMAEDFAYISEQVVNDSASSFYFCGPPILALEILSPTDRYDFMAEKVRTYLQHGTRMVLMVDPYSQTVTQHKPHSKPVLFSEADVLDSGSELPGFQACVREFFT